MKWFISITCILIGMVLAFLATPKADLYFIKPEFKNYQRVVSLAPSMSHTLEALNQHHRLVGVTIHCEGQNFTHAKKIGSFAQPNFEAIIALKPDLVVGIPHVMANPILDRLREAHIEVFAHQPDSLRDIKFIVSELARLFAIDRLGAQINEQIDIALKQGSLLIKTSPQSATKKTVLFVVSHLPFVVAGEKTFPSQVLAILGLQNQAHHENVSWPIWSTEQLLLDPPTFLIMANPENAAYFAKLVSTPDNEVKNLRLISPKRPLFSSPSPAIIHDIHELTNLLIAHL